MGRLLSVSEVAQRVGVSRQAIQARAQRGTLRAIKVAGEWRISEDVAEALVRAERDKGIATGQVRPLPGASDAADSLELAEFAARVTRLEQELLQRDEDRAELLRAHAQQLAAKDSELESLRAERHRLRAAISSLVADD